MSDTPRGFEWGGAREDGVQYSKGIPKKFWIRFILSHILYALAHAVTLRTLNDCMIYVWVCICELCEACIISHQTACQPYWQFVNADCNATPLHGWFIKIYSIFVGIPQRQSLMDSVILLLSLLLLLWLMLGPNNKKNSQESTLLQYFPI